MVFRCLLIFNFVKVQHQNRLRLSIKRNLSSVYGPEDSVGVLENEPAVVVDTEYQSADSFRFFSAFDANTQNSTFVVEPSFHLRFPLRIEETEKERRQQILKYLAGYYVVSRQQRKRGGGRSQPSRVLFLIAVHTDSDINPVTSGFAQDSGDFFSMNEYVVRPFDLAPRANGILDCFGDSDAGQERYSAGRYVNSRSFQSDGE